MSNLDSWKSWVVAVSSSLIYLLISWPMRLGAQLFVSMLDRYATNRKDASFPFALASLMRSVSGPFAGFFGGVIGLETVTFIGCLFCTLGVGGCFFAERMFALDISLGIIYGIGFGWSTCLVPEILNRNFQKHRNKAYGLYFGGGGIGAFLSPPILEIILYSFGVSGTFLIMCGIILHSVPAAMLLYLPKTTRRTPKVKDFSNRVVKHSLRSKRAEGDNLFVSETIINNQPLLDIEVHDTENQVESSLKVTSNTTNDSSLSEQPSINTQLLDQAHSLTDKNPIHNTFQVTSTEHFSLINIEPHKQSLDELHNSKKVSNNAESKNFDKSLVVLTKYQPHEKPKDSNSPNSNPATRSSIKSSFHSVNILWHPLFLLISSIQGINIYLNYLFWTITVDMMRDKGIEQNREVYFVMCLSLFDTVGRFFLGTLIDCGLLSVASLCAMCFAVAGFSCFLLTWLIDFYSNIAAICLLGLVFGGNTACLPGTITEFIREEKRAIAMSSRLVMYIPISFTMPALIGYFRGKLGSYNGLLYVMTTVSVTCGIITFFLPKISKRGFCRQAQNNDE